MPNSQEIRVAIIDDDEDDYFIISEYIRNIEGSKFRIDWCNNYDDAIRKMNSRDYDIYFVDYRLGTHTGLELLKEIGGESFDEPVVLLTGKGNKKIDVQAMESGATDYLVKTDLNTEKLERCIRYSLDRAASMKELRARENKYRNLFEGSKDAVFIAREDLTLTEVNEAASELFASGTVAIAGRSFYEFIKNATEKNQVLELLVNNESINDLEIEIENDNGETLSYLLSTSFLDDSGGERLIHGILHDITNIKIAEMANLQAQKLAANERLMRILAHEIRNPLNNIILSVDHFKSISLNGDTSDGLVDIIQRNCMRINTIITELLDLTKPPELSFQKHTLQEILDDSIAMTSDRINLKEIRLEKDYPDFPVEIMANRSKLTIAFTNILINATEAMESKNGELRVSLTRSGNNYMVCIRDNGKGIPEEYLSKLFEPFFTLKKNGMGLGLAASYSIMQSHQAKIKVETEVDKGTEFIISFVAN